MAEHPQIFHLVSVAETVPATLKDLYETSFPTIERRPWQHQLELLQGGQLRLSQLMQGDIFCGFVFFWSMPLFVFIEHMAVVPEMRGAGAGSMLLQLMAVDNSSIVLETELPETAGAARRIRFYERNGYQAFPGRYQQPPYANGYPWLEMQLMYRQGDASLPSFSEITRMIYAGVYGIAP